MICQTFPSAVNDKTIPCCLGGCLSVCLRFLPPGFARLYAVTTRHTHRVPVGVAW